MQAIITKYLAPTNARGSRIKAVCAAGNITIPYSYDGDAEHCHRQAAEALVAKLGWTGEHYGRLICGGLPDDAGYCFVFTK